LEKASLFFLFIYKKRGVLVFVFLQKKAGKTTENGRKKGRKMKQKLKKTQKFFNFALVTY